MSNERVHSKDVYEAACQALRNRGVRVQDIAEIVYTMQSPYQHDLLMATCMESVEAVLEKREVQHALLVAIEIDILAEQGKLSEPLLSIVRSDESLFGCDETLALGSVFGYGSIAVTTFGYLDKEKIGIVKNLDVKSESRVNTFLDDMVCSIAASASSRLAHRIRDAEEASAELHKDEEQIG